MGFKYVFFTSSLERNFKLMNKVKLYKAENEPVLGYKAGSKERNNVEK